MNKLQRGLGALAAAGTLSVSMMAPASADGAASTRNIIFGVAALAGLAIESNVAHKKSQENSVVGYLPNGSAVFGDGHIVNGNGYSYYPGNNGQSVSCSNGQCSLSYTNASRNGYNGYSNDGYNGNGGNYYGNADPNGGFSNFTNHNRSTTRNDGNQ